MKNSMASGTSNQFDIREQYLLSGLIGVEAISIRGKEISFMHLTFSKLHFQKYLSMEKSGRLIATLIFVI